MRYLINKPDFNELLRCFILANFRGFVKYLRVAPLLGYNSVEYRLVYSGLRIAVAELSHFNEITTRVMETTVSTSVLC